MKTFEDVYQEVVKDKGNSVEEMARIMYEEGRSITFTQNLDDLSKDTNMLIELIQFTALKMAEHSVKCNASDLSVSSELTIDGNRYFTRMSSITFYADKKPLEKRAHEIAKSIFKVSEVSCIEDVQAMLEEAVLAGYNLRKEDFEED